MKAHKSHIPISRRQRQLATYLLSEGYVHVRFVDEQCVAIQRYLTTWGLCYGLDDLGMSGRFCYQDRLDALDAILALDHMLGRHEAPPTGPWIKHKGSGIDVSNPQLAEAF